jgi:hypothetical protein
MSPTLRTAALALATYAAGCGAAHEDARVSPPAVAVVAAAPIPPPAPGEWRTWSHAQKLAYMKTTFMDAERALFATWEPVRYRDLECRTCHGTTGVGDGSFRMPNPDLPKVAPSTAGFTEIYAHEPQVFTFMSKRVVPETARLLGLPAFDFEKHTGFSCYQCHVRLTDESEGAGPQHPPAAVEATTPVPVPAPGEWKTWSHAQRLAYMKSTFMDSERALFATWEPVRYRSLECRTCHGSASVSSGAFRMPNPDLPRIAPEDEAFKELQAREPEVLAFMSKQVVPETARLLGLPEHGLESCPQCHVRLTDLSASPSK